MQPEQLQGATVEAVTNAQAEAEFAELLSQIPADEIDSVMAELFAIRARHLH